MTASSFDWRGRVLIRVSVCASVAVFLGASAFAQTASPKPVAPTVLSHDQHDHLTISVDPYTEDARARDKFGKANPIDAGILPVEVFLRNDSDDPMRINLETVQLEVTVGNGSKQQVDWLRPEEVAALIAHPAGTATPQQRRLPLPIVPSDKKVEKLTAILRPLTLDADVIPPKGSIHGFLYFNVSHEMSLANTSSLFVPDVVIAPSNNPLVFFDIPLRKAPVE